MLQNIREKLTGWVALAVLGTIGLSFVFVGGANFATIGSNYAAKVDDAEVGIAEFENAYREQLRTNPQFAALPDEYRLQLRSNILDQLIQQQVVDNYLDDAGYRVSDEQLTKVVHQIPEFQVDGRFDRGTYEQLLSVNNMTPLQFEASQKISMRRQQLQRAILASSVVPPSNYRRFLNLAFENRLVTMATITADAVASEVSVTDEMVSAHYDDNPTLFNLPESADIEYIELLRETVAEGVVISEQQLRSYYDENKDLYLQDERRQARHILILFDGDEAGAENVANEILTRARGGESFAELASQYSKDGATSSNGGDLGARSREQLPEAVADIAFAMLEGDIRGPVKGDFGFHVVKLDNILEPGPLPFEQVRGSLLSELQQQEADDLFLGLERKMSGALFDATDIRTLAEVIDGEVKSVAGFVRDSVEPFAGSQIAVDAIFDPVVLSGVQMSEVIEIDANRTVVFAVTEHHEATRDTLDNVRAAIVTTLTDNQSENLMAERAQTMLDAVNAGEQFTDAAAAIGAITSEPKIMTRSAEDEDQFIAVAVFTAIKPTQDNPTLGSTRNGVGGYTVYSLDAVIPGRPQTIPLAERDAGRVQLQNEYGVGDYSAFVQSLIADAEVIINQDALAAKDLFR